MKTNQVLLSAVIASVALATSSFAAAENSVDLTKYLGHYNVLRTDIPLPLKVVAPSGLPRSFQGTTINVTMLIDRDGRPQDVRIVSPISSELAALLMPVLTQWRFSPAMKDGVPFAQKVELPIHLS